MYMDISYFVLEKNSNISEIMLFRFLFNLQQNVLKDKKLIKLKIQQYKNLTFFQVIWMHVFSAMFHSSEGPQSEQTLVFLFGGKNQHKFNHHIHVPNNLHPNVCMRF